MSGSIELIEMWRDSAEHEDLVEDKLPDARTFKELLGCHLLSFLAMRFMLYYTPPAVEPVYTVCRHSMANFRASFSKGEIQCDFSLRGKSGSVWFHLARGR